MQVALAPTAETDSESDQAVEVRAVKKEAKNKAAARMFLTQGTSLESFYIIMRSLLPEVALMKALVRSNSDQFDTLATCNVLEGEARQFRVLELYQSSQKDSRAMSVCMRRYGELLENQQAGTWKHLTHSEATSNEVVRQVLRGASLLHEQLIRRTQMYPYKAFSLLQLPDDVQAEEFVREALATPCVLDQCTRRLFTQFANGSLSMPDLKALLTMVALDAFGNTHPIESLHSSNARRARRRVHSVPMKVADLDMWLQASAAPHWSPQACHPSQALALASV